MIPPVGSFVRRVGGEIRYRVTSRSERGCLVDAVDQEVTDVPGRQPRPLHYLERRASLAMCGGRLLDDRWRPWEAL